MYRRCALLAALLLISASSRAASAPAPLTHEEKVDIVDDSLQMTAWLMRDTTVTNEPLIILLHQMGQTHESYQPFIEALSKYVAEDMAHRVMPTIVSFDLRGHGRSTQRKKETLSAATMADAEFMKMPRDIQHMISWLKTDPSLGVDTSNIIVVGASIGANTAIMLTELLPGVRKVAMLSPGKLYHGLAPAEALTKYQGQMMIMTSKGDIYSTKSTEYLADLNKSHCTVEWLAGEEHGTEIINGDSHPMRKLVDWVMK